MLNKKNLLNGSFYLFLLIYVINWLNNKDYLVWVIGILSVVYLVIYFSIGTLTVLIASFEELGALALASTNFSNSPLLTVVFLSMTVLIIWIFSLLFWPLFLIPDNALIKDKVKYNAIDIYEAQVKDKYND